MSSRSGWCPNLGFIFRCDPEVPASASIYLTEGAIVGLLFLYPFAFLFVTLILCFDFHRHLYPLGMAYIDQFLSREALLLLASEDDNDKAFFTGTKLDSNGSQTSPWTQNGEDGRGLGENLERPGTPNQSGSVSTVKRAKFEPKRRAEVAELRRRGACLKCRLSKTPVRPQPF